MSLLTDLIEMDAPVAAGDAAATTSTNVAGTRGSLFDGGVVDSKKEKSKRRRMLRRVTSMPALKESLGVDLGRTDFDAADIISQIDAASKKEKQNDDTTAFGLEDEDGNMVKVYVRNDQAKEFENKLAIMLAGEDEDDDEDNSSLEIAEVLFKIKDEFDIVDVEWPGIEGDVEEEQEVAGGEVPMGAEAGEVGGAMDDKAAAPGDLEGIEVDAEGEADAEEDMVADEEGAESALKQVIDMMKADAEAKMAEAKAREAEARAKEAEYSGQAAATKVKKEEQIFDMEAEEKMKSDQKKESEKMAKLARYRHQKAQNAEVKLSMEGKEESKDSDGPWRVNHDEADDELTLKELTQLIMRNLGHN